MTHELETDLRAVLAARAAEIPDNAVRRLRTRDYRPRTRAVQRPPIALGGLAAAGAALAAVLFVELGTGTPAAFAGWSATPTHAGEQQTTAAEAACRDRLATMQTPPSGGPAQASPGTLAPVLTDTRGPFTFVILANDHASASCISSPSFTALSGSASSASTVPAAGTVTLAAADHTARDGQAYSFAEGHTGAGVSATTLILSDGTRVQASSANGWFVAWWPGARQVTGAEVTTGQGTTTQHFDTARPMQCPQGSVCTGGYSSSGARGGGMSGGGMSVTRSGS